MIRGLVAGVFLWTAAMAQAQTSDPATLAEDALAKFGAAQEQLRSAQSANDRVKALTKVVTAYEEGLEVMRASLRQLALREGELSRAFADESGDVAALLGVLINLRADASPAALVHPTGPLGHARAGMLVSAITPQMHEDAEVLRVQLQEVSILRELRNDSLSQLTEGLKEVQAARTQLSEAISERVDLPRRFDADPERVRVLIESSESLEALAASLAVMDVVDGLEALPSLDDARGTWQLPVQGDIIYRYNATDAAGVTRPGWLVGTRALSLVVAPWPSTLRYRGPFLDYGNVMILEPENDVLLVLAGLEESYGDVGEVIPAGTAIGLMGGETPDLDAFVENATLGTGTALSETLYIEIREGGKPVDPAIWFKE